MRENGIGINRGNPFLKKGDLPGDVIIKLNKR